MGILKSSKSKALVASKENREKRSNKKQKSWKQNSQQYKELSTSSPKDNSNNKGKSSKKEFLTCAYCQKNGHEEHHCYKKEIDELKNLLKKNQISVPSRMANSHSDFDKGNDHIGKGQDFLLQAKI